MKSKLNVIVFIKPVRVVISVFLYILSYHLFSVVSNFPLWEQRAILFRIARRDA